ncbi:hypothetical protein ACFHYQ_00805 [Sphaerimonospora cavernae]|uniref:Secreted protein n=1 Tax=Sphaerimonospora cavernae TaxID=1740611 RepID=A0ABV6U123_9ACTN
MTKRKRRSSAPAERWGLLAELGLTAGQQRMVLWGGSVVGVLLAALLLTLMIDKVAGGERMPARGAGSLLGEGRPESYQAWPSPKEFRPIADRRADTAPLTTKEVFGARTLTAGKVTLKRVASQADPGCSGTVWGGGLTDLLATSECRQAVRGLYRSADGAYVAQYTLLDLADVRAANGVVDELKSMHLGGWTLPLEQGRQAFQGHSEASGHAMGHYAGLVWVARADGAEPGERDDFVALGLAVRGVEKALYRRIVAVAGLPSEAPDPGSAHDTAQPSEPAPTDPPPQ